MPNLNRESRLITPGGALWLIIIVGAFCVWYFDIDLWEHMVGIRDTIHYVTGGIL